MYERPAFMPNKRFGRLPSFWEAWYRFLMFYIRAALFLWSSAPITRLLCLAIQVLTVWGVGLTANNRVWACWILILVYLGGIIVVFAYVILSAPDQPLNIAVGLGLVWVLRIRVCPLRVSDGTLGLTLRSPLIMLVLAWYLLGVLIAVEGLGARQARASREYRDSGFGFG